MQDKAEIGIIGGSGLYAMPGFRVEEELALDTPWGIKKVRLRCSRGILAFHKT